MSPSEVHAPTVPGATPPRPYLLQGAMSHAGTAGLPRPGPYLPGHTQEGKGVAQQHRAFVLGDIGDGENMLVRVHSECLTGDLSGSLRCDCGPQLDAALAADARDGRGVVPPEQLSDNRRAVLRTKDVIAGFCVIEAPDLDAALAIARRNPILQEGGGVEVRRTYAD